MNSDESIVNLIEHIFKTYQLFVYVSKIKMWGITFIEKNLTGVCYLNPKVQQLFDIFYDISDR